MSEAFREHNAREQKWVAALDADERRALVSVLGKLSATAQSDWVNHR